MLKFSTGLRNSILATGSLRARLNGKVLRMYGGAVPGTADASLGGATLLTTLSDDATGDGLEFDDTPVNAVLFKEPSQIWRGLNVATANATFYRLVDPSDAGDESESAERVQGTVGAGGGADMNLSSVGLVSGAFQTCDFYSIELPTA